MATGTPVIARRAGALTETIEHGVTGFLVDDVSEASLALERVTDLDRRKIRKATLERFSPARMTDDYEAVYRELIAEHRARGVGVAIGPGRRDRRIAEAERVQRVERAGRPADTAEVPVETAARGS